MRNQVIIGGLLRKALLPAALLASAASAASAAPGAGGPRLGDAGAAPAVNHTLCLGEVTFDPLVGEPDLPLAWKGVSEEGPDLHLVQFEGPIRSDWLSDLREEGVEIVQYIHPYTYVVWTEPAAANEARLVQAVRWTGAFHPAYRVQPAFRALAPDVIAARAMLYRGADTDAAVDAIVALGAVETGRRIMDDTFEIASFDMPGDLFEPAARVRGVYSLRPVPTDGGLRGEMTAQINAGNYDGSNQVFPGYSSWLSAIGLDGTGVKLAVVDSGVQGSHQDLVKRMTACTGITCTSLYEEHGTHVAGVMAGDGTSGVDDGFGFRRALGVAPGANILAQSYSPFFLNAGGMLLLMSDSYNSGAVASNNSWGPSWFPWGYDDDTRQVDVGTRDTDPMTPGHQPLTYVLAFNNGNGGTSTQGTPDDAKNIISVGSTNGQMEDGAQNLDIDSISPNSSHGPALDGRTIPHLVAPGCRVDSSVLNNGYDLFCGTSMSAPQVTGAVGLFVQMMRQRPDYVADPSPALAKAALLAVCHDLAGNLDADGGTLGHPFDSKQGWGRLDLPPVLDPPADSVRYFDQHVVLDETGESWNIDLTTLDPGRPVRMMLAWTDAPGHGLGGSTPAWVNDLDLVVETDAGTFRGNNFGPDGYSTPGGVADARNNTEGVFLPAGLVSALNVRVVAASIAGDGLPGFGDDTDQDFALVVYNVTEEPGFALQAAPSAASVCAPAGAEYTIEVGQILGFAEPVTLSASGQPAGATVSFEPNPVMPGAAATMTVGETAGIAAGAYSISVQGAAGGLNRYTTANLTLSTDSPPAPDLAVPADGAEDVSIVPAFAWAAADQAAGYELQVATDAAFTDVVYDAMVDGTSHAIDLALERTTTYYWRVRASNPCGDSGYAPAWSFTTKTILPILLVDDDDNYPDVQALYADALDYLNVEYEVWDTERSDYEPSAADLAPYGMVIWFTGYSFDPFTGPGAFGEESLAAWLDQGGCLLLSSQDYLFTRGRTDFGASYLGIGAYMNDAGFFVSVSGRGSVFGDLGDYSLSYPFGNYSDRVSPDPELAELAFFGADFFGFTGDAGVNRRGPNYSTVFLAFPLEAIVTVQERAEIIQTVREWCGLAAPPCPADITGPVAGAPDGNVDELDAVQLIGSWASPCAGACGGADITGPTPLVPDGNVDSLDFLLLIAQWGSPGNCAGE